MKTKGAFQTVCCSLARLLPSRKGLVLTILLAGFVQTGMSAPARGQSMNSRRHAPALPPVRFAVLSDPHLYSDRLGTAGAAFEDYLRADPKLLIESTAIFEAALDSIIEEQVKFVLISGDLTKDGEHVNHVLMTHYLQKLEQRGIQVFVVPGNHDINNPDAVAFEGDATRSVTGVTPQRFRALYGRFGYNQAFARDRHSLSYVTEPAKGLWLLAIDSCKYEESKTSEHPVIGGRIRSETMAWIQGVMVQAIQQGKRVIAFMHHGVNQHFFGEAELFGDWLLDDWASTSLQLAQSGLKVVFTGHYHSTDAAWLVDANRQPLSPLVDIETASLATYPCAYRIASLDADGQLSVGTRRVTEIDFDTGALPFQQYAFNAIWAPTLEIATIRIMDLFGLPREQAEAYAPLVTQAVIANYEGDEAPGVETLTLIQTLMNSANPLQQQFGLILGGLWFDLPPSPDSELIISLTDD